MKKLLYCMIALLCAACMPQKPAKTESAEIAMLVGTYTDGGSKGIYTFRFNQETGVSTALNSFELPNPSYLAVSEDGQFVYAVSEMDGVDLVTEAPAEQRTYFKRRSLLYIYQRKGSADRQLFRWHNGCISPA